MARIRPLRERGAECRWRAGRRSRGAVRHAAARRGRRRICVPDAVRPRRCFPRTLYAVKAFTAHAVIRIALEEGSTCWPPPAARSRPACARARRRPAWCCTATTSPTMSFRWPCAPGSRWSWPTASRSWSVSTSSPARPPGCSRCSCASFPRSRSRRTRPSPPATSSRSSARRWPTRSDVGPGDPRAHGGPVRGAPRPRRLAGAVGRALSRGDRRAGRPGGEAACGGRGRGPHAGRGRGFRRHVCGRAIARSERGGGGHDGAPAGSVRRGRSPPARAGGGARPHAGGEPGADALPRGGHETRGWQDPGGGGRRDVRQHPAAALRHALHGAFRGSGPPRRGSIGAVDHRRQALRVRRRAGRRREVAHDPGARRPARVRGDRRVHLRVGQHLQPRGTARGGGGARGPGRALAPARGPGRHGSLRDGHVPDRALGRRPRPMV